MLFTRRKTTGPFTFKLPQSQNTHRIKSLTKEQKSEQKRAVTNLSFNHQSITTFADHASKTALNLKPFSRECTLNDIEVQFDDLNKNRVNTHHTISKTTMQNEKTKVNFMDKFDQVIRIAKRRRKKRFKSIPYQNDEDSIDEDYDAGQTYLTNVTNDKIKRQKTIESINSHLCINFGELLQQKTPKNKLKTATNRQIHKFSSQKNSVAKTFSEKTYYPARKSQNKVLLKDFNKNNCYLFSRSKHKIMKMEAEQEKLQKKQKKTVNPTITSIKWSNMFYKSYLKCYQNRKKLLKGNLDIDHFDNIE